jgi:hypothetical protein
MKDRRALRWHPWGAAYLDDSRLTPSEKRDRLYVLQEGKCGACGAPGLPCAAPGRKGKLFLDHDHYTGLVRGLICQPCNQREGIMDSGLMRGDYSHITAYLASPPAADLDWLWDFPAGWTYADFERLHKIGGISALEYVRSHGLVVTRVLAA